MLTIQGMYGLGDNIYQRAVVRKLGPVQLFTPWPQLYADLPEVRCLPVQTALRTQAKNANRADLTWAVPERPTAVRTLSYVQHADRSILDALFRSVGIAPPLCVSTFQFDLPDNHRLPTRACWPYVLVRPPTVRKEWPAASRNPDWRAVEASVAEARRRGYYVVSVADLRDRHEWLDGPPIQADLTLHHGELRLEELLSMVQHAAGVLGGVGWLLPAALAYRVPMLLLYGGWGKMNGPQRVLDPRLDTSLLVQATPDPFCMCNRNDHTCPKAIPTETLHGRLEDFFGLLGRPVAGLVA